jgi:hypothetical protein
MKASGKPERTFAAMMDWLVKLAFPLCALIVAWPQMAAAARDAGGH